MQIKGDTSVLRITRESEKGGFGRGGIAPVITECGLVSARAQVRIPVIGYFLIIIKVKYMLPHPFTSPNWQLDVKLPPERNRHFTVQ